MTKRIPDVAVADGLALPRAVLVGHMRLVAPRTKLPMFVALNATDRRRS